MATNYYNFGQAGITLQILSWAKPRKPAFVAVGFALSAHCPDEGDLIRRREQRQPIPQSRLDVRPVGYP